MSDNQRNPENGKNDQNDETKLGPRTLLVWLAIVVAIVALLTLRTPGQVAAKTLSYPEFIQKVDDKLIRGGRITYNPQTSDLREITGQYVEVGDNGKPVLVDGKEKETPFTIKIPITDKLVEKLLASGAFVTKEPNTLLWSVLASLLPILLFGALIYFFFIRNLKMAGKSAMSFGKSKAKMLNKDKNKTTFKDVAGVEEAKDEVCELVEFLKDPKKFQKLGGRIPKGILMIGAPGTGKTLLAKAIAGEADASFFSISGSDFVEMFVGVGASRVRDMFEQARKNTPCLIFIDEIDAVGRSRGIGLGGGNDEREQTLNALLVEMDGFDTTEGIIIIAATNRPDVLDPALLRPGRFDRQITVNLPDVRGREAILKVHARNVKMDPTAELSVIARGTPGFSGAELANLLNEAALLAARQNKKSVGMTELNEARDKVRWGRERRSLAMTDEEKQHTAWHEAGHALVNVLLPHTHPLHKVTIIPRGRALGLTMMLPEKDVFSQRRKNLLDDLAVTMAGRIAEEIVADDISSGASGDIQQATQIARAMVCQLGMSDKLGMINYAGESEFYGGRELTRRSEHSEHTAMEIDAEVKRIIDESYAVAKRIILENRDKLESIAKALLEFETLDGPQVEEIVRTGKMTNPPPPAALTATPMTGAPAGTPVPEPPRPTPPPLEPGLGAPAPAPI
ncbi:MAG: ATP-dependent metallopeptidase FtsH/Yme1/Tma family protein [Verrucomicrobia bacterium]|nr:ATP-dependent metallopeptidase FtsH/Yme1/Tma family protein [Verrucomicrobiota bacterium]